ncbi:hypothetical protein [Yersinia entomophaga]
MIDWPNQQVRKILKCCRKAMRADPTIINIEAVIG